MMDMVDSSMETDGSKSLRMKSAIDRRLIKLVSIRDCPVFTEGNCTTIYWVESFRFWRLCCECGTVIPPNSANTCPPCLRIRTDATQGIPRQAQLGFCRLCERYLAPPSRWVSCALESRELLTLCLKKLKSALTKVHLVDAGFIWTEPHSRRIKLKLTIQKEVQPGCVLQQVAVVEFVVVSQTCDECHRRNAKDFWRAVVQLRQQTTHKKTFFYLEQLILKHGMHNEALRIKENHDGLDFYFAAKQQARKLVDFLLANVPCRYKMSEKLISHDIHNNTFNYKHSFSVEIAPVCKDEVVCLPRKLAQSLGNMNQLCVCTRVTSAIHLIDPATLQVAEVTGSVFWRQPFKSLCSATGLHQFVVLDVEAEKDEYSVAGRGAKSRKHLLAAMWVQRAHELGSSRQLHTRSHLGHLLQPGDVVLGVDLANANLNNKDFDDLKLNNLPDVILVKKFYNRQHRRNRRNWCLKRIEMEGESKEKADVQFEDFEEDLEEDEILRKNVNIYSDPGRARADSDVDEDAPMITLAEMLHSLQLEQGAEMLTE
uniref:60S ribosomal export protein NMD3 isoform X1 n=1 Tax=Myxine glutinosa TaxID=7769 RepID=UPI00358E301C